MAEAAPTRKIVCVHCNAILTIRGRASTDVVVECPRCHNAEPLSKYAEHVPAADATIIGVSPHKQLGRLKVLPNGPVYELSVGRTLVGRESARREADFCVPCATNNTSRSHVAIDVTVLSNGAILHKISLAKERVNATYINDMRLEPGDVVNLTPSQTVRLPDFSFILEL